MKKTPLVATSGGLAVLFAGLLMVLYAHPSCAAEPPAGPAPQSKAAYAPIFVLRDIENRAVSLRDFRGKVVLVYFTTTWCPYCKRDIPRLKNLYASMRGKPFEILAVYVNESTSRVRAFAEKYELPYRVLVDTDAHVARLYGVRGVPMRVVVDKAGKVGCYQCPSPEDAIGELLRR